MLLLQRGVYLLPSAYEMPPEVQGLKGEVKEPSLAVSSHSTQTKYTFYRAPLLTLRRVPLFSLRKDPTVNTREDKHLCFFGDGALPPANQRQLLNSSLFARVGSTQLKPI